MYYLNHVVTWSKIGRDGREVYLSLNWDLVQEGTNSQYIITSQVYNDGPNNSTPIMYMYFVLGKTGEIFFVSFKYVHQFISTSILELKVDLIIL